MSTCCTIWISGHGYQPVSEQEQSVSMATRSQSTITYDGTLTVFQLSMAGLANVTTEMGIIYKKFKHLKRTGDFLTPEIVKLLHHRSTEYATLTWLVRKIYNNQYNKCEENMVRSKLEQLIEEMLILEKLASIVYARSSLPTIIPNPMFNKVYSLKPNPGENTRNDSSMRSNPIRTMGYPPHNKLWAFYGMFFLDTSDPDHKRFSISNLRVDENDFVDPRAIMNINILTLSNYNTFWSGHLDTRDFSGVPDTSVSDIGDDLETSIAIFKEFCQSIGIAKPEPKQSIIIIPPGILAPCIETLRVVVETAANYIIHAIKQLHESANIVSDARAEFKRTADLANKAEDQYNKLLTHITRSVSTTVGPALLAAYNTAETDWQQAKDALDQAKANDTRANENAQQVENQASQVIIAAIKKCIHDIIISSKEHIAIDIRIILKNIIMSNKLKNILKTAILNKKISSNQIILFFSGLGYKVLGIADPACCVAKPLKDPSSVDKIMQLDTQELYDSSFVPPPLFEDILNFISLNISNKHSRAGLDTHSSGGTKRKRRMRIYSRKRRMRRRKYTRRRRHSRIVY
jgi:hypothetical protein